MTPGVPTLVLAGALVSGLGTLAGFGGGFLLVPLLVSLAGTEIHVTVAASVVAIFPASLLATVFNLRRGLVSLRVAAVVQVTAIACAWGGAQLSARVPSRELRLLFGVFVGLLGLKLAAGLLQGDDDAEEGPTWTDRLNALPPVLTLETPQGTSRVGVPAAAILGACGGVLSGLLGLGGGFLYSPALYRLFRLPPPVAAATSLAMVVVTSLVAALGHYQLGNLRSDLAGPLVGGFVLGAAVASAFNERLADRAREILVATSLLAAAALMLLGPG